jgi:hypothetical protein
MSEPKEGEVVERKEGDLPKNKTYFHPLSGMVILGVDWLAWGLDFFSGFTAVLAVAAGSFGVTYAAVTAIQQKLHGDDPKTARKKAMMGAAAAGVPFPVTGTIVGAAIIALSGLKGFGFFGRKK